MTKVFRTDSRFEFRHSFVIRHLSFVIMSDVQIHPTAIVDPGAEIGAGTIVGAYCVIGADVMLGPDCWLQHNVTLCGPMKAGAKNKFYAYCSIGQQTQDLKYRGEPTYLEIGAENTFREFVTISRSTSSQGKTLIGNRGTFLAYSHIAHDCIVGDDVVFSNNGTLAGHVVVGDHAVIGGLTAVHQFCRIGRFAITGGCSKIVQDIPPFMIADGNPAEIRGINLIGLERKNFPPESVKLIKEAFRLIYRSKYNTRQAVEAMRKELPHTEEITEIIAFIEQSERGIIRRDLNRGIRE
jgi:UDP-N-acetylglucosamine acyltransferase